MSLVCARAAGVGLAGEACGPDLALLEVIVPEGVLELALNNVAGEDVGVVGFKCCECRFISIQCK